MAPAVVITELTAAPDGMVQILGSVNGSELRCSVVVIADGTEQLQMSAFLVSGQRVLTGSGPLHISGGQHRDGTFYCRAHHGTSFDVEITTMVPVAIQTIDMIGIVTSKAAATISSVTVFDVPSQISK